MGYMDCDLFFDSVLYHFGFAVASFVCHHRMHCTTGSELPERTQITNNKNN